ncbi:MAG: dihydropteroate synthase [Cyanobium sp.]
MGVLNLTPDSFSDGGRLNSVPAALKAAKRMLAEGADLLDLGGQSTRPGAEIVGPEVELQRLLPVLEALQQLRAAHPGSLISVDTFEASVAEAALAAGADWINDVRGANHSPDHLCQGHLSPVHRHPAQQSAGHHGATEQSDGDSSLRDPRMLPLIARAGCPYVLMHSRGTSQTMDDRAVYGDVVAEVRSELLAATQQALAAGVRTEQIVWDPGLGFAKTTEQNLELLRRLGELRSAGFPLLVGPSRKRFIGAVLGEARPRARLWGTAAVCALAVAAGARVVRVHDVAPIRQVVRMADALRPISP